MWEETRRGAVQAQPQLKTMCKVDLGTQSGWDELEFLQECDVKEESPRMSIFVCRNFHASTCHKLAWQSTRWESSCGQKSEQEPQNGAHCREPSSLQERTNSSTRFTKKVQQQTKRLTEVKTGNCSYLCTEREEKESLQVRYLSSRGIWVSALEFRHSESGA